MSNNNFEIINEKVKVYVVHETYLKNTFYSKDEFLTYLSKEENRLYLLNDGMTQDDFLLYK